MGKLLAIILVLLLLVSLTCAILLFAPDACGLVKKYDQTYYIPSGA